MKTVKNFKLWTIIVALILGGMMRAAAQTSSSNCPNHSVTFTQTQLANPLSVELTALPVGFANPSANNNRWIDKSNGTPFMQSPNFTYTFPQKGVYPITLISDDGNCRATYHKAPVSVGGCTMRASQTHTVNANGVSFAASAVNGTPPYTYQWYYTDYYGDNNLSYAGGTSNIVVPIHSIPSSNSFMKLRVTDAAGCLNEATDSMPILHSCPNLSFSLTQTPLANNQVQIAANATGGTAPYTYHYEYGWYNTTSSHFIQGSNVNSFVANLADADIVNYTVVDATGCAATASLNVNHLNCQGADLELNRVIDIPNNTVTFSIGNGSVRQWTRIDPASYYYSFTQTVTAPANTPTSYIINATNSAGCLVTKYFHYEPCGFTHVDASYTLSPTTPNEVHFAASVSGGTPPYTYAYFSVGGIFNPGNSTSSSPDFTTTFTGLGASYERVMYMNVTDATGCTERVMDSLTLGNSFACTSGNCVFPGDANHDGTANLYDVLVLGADYGHTGFTRADATIDWYAHDSNNWGSVSPTINVNKKHADCNGNGTINYSDTTAIGLNYHRTHNGVVPTNRLATALPVYLQFSSDSVVLASGVLNNLYADVFVGTSAIAAQNLYGMAMTLNYPNSLVQQDSVAKVIYDVNSFLGQPADILLFQHDMRNATPTSGELDFAITRTNHTDVNGFGRVCRVKWVITENISGRGINALQNRLREMFTVSLSGIRANNNQLQIIDAQGAGDQILLVGKQVTGTDNVTEWAKNVLIFPNPVSAGNLTIDLGDNIGNQLKLTNAVGQNILEQPLQKHQELDLSSLPQGVYFLILQTDLGSLTKRIVVAK